MMTMEHEAVALAADFGLRWSLIIEAAYRQWVGRFPRPATRRVDSSDLAAGDVVWLNWRYGEIVEIGASIGGDRLATVRWEDTSCTEQREFGPQGVNSYEVVQR
jgi:hypothetical protein